MSHRLILALLLVAGAHTARADVRDDFHREMPPSIPKPGESREPILPLSPNTIVGHIIHRSSDGKLAILRIERGILYKDTALVARDHACVPKAFLRPIPPDKPSTVVAVAIEGGVVTVGDEVVIPGATLEKSARARFLPEKPAEPAAVTTAPGNPPSPAGGR